MGRDSDAVAARRSTHTALLTHTPGDSRLYLEGKRGPHSAGEDIGVGMPQQHHLREKRLSLSVS